MLKFFTCLVKKWNDKNLIQFLSCYFKLEMLKKAYSGQKCIQILKYGREKIEGGMLTHSYVFTDF